MELPEPGDGARRWSAAAMIALSLVILNSIDLGDLQEFLWNSEPALDSSAGLAVPSRTIAAALWLELAAFGIACFGVIGNSLLIVSTIPKSNIHGTLSGDCVTIAIVSVPVFALFALIASVSVLLALGVFAASFIAFVVMAYLQCLTPSEDSTSSE